MALLGKSRLVNGARVGRELSATTASSRLIILSCANGAAGLLALEGRNPANAFALKSWP